MSEGRSESGCAGCSIACHRPGQGGRGDKLAAYGALWGLAGPELGELVAAYHHRCDDLGLEAFETARALALARQTGRLEASPGGLLAALDEIDQGTELGRILGSGAEIAARAFGLSLAGAPAGPAKTSGPSPEEDALMDTLGLCGFAAAGLAGNPAAWAALAAMLEAKTGQPAPVSALAGLGRAILALEKSFGPGQ
ncbi:MAG: aldehyde ferredoxin oxidoreductase C-terminal domain-containing protein [Candidatus Adiutrix sp.]|jgi:aldehyde:ferredoxin oxidoreductase|nr:aldehyde ferredoxin oxidoreductase C-terminal domain-containing protein [Candidatus Adiutrix sp.]